MEQAPPRLHPVLIIAAVSVTALSLVGIGVLTGIIPGKDAAPANAPAPVATPAPVTAAAPPPVAPTTTSVAINVNPAPPAPVVAARGAVAPRTVTRIVERPAPPIEVVRGEPIREFRENRPTPAPAAVCRDCGIVESVQESAQEGGGSGLGAVAGSVVGGVLGNQMGKGSGRDLATIVGLVGGAVVGNEVEKGQRKNMRYDVVVRMDDGSTRTMSTHVQPAWRVGERVKVSSGALVTPDYR